MFKYFALIVVVFCSLLGSAKASSQWLPYLPMHGSTGSDHYGLLSASNQTFSNITLHGPANVEKCMFLGATTLMGMLTASDSVFEELAMSGVCELKNTIISGILSLKGLLRAENSTFNTIEASTTALTLKNSVVENIIIQASEVTPQYVYLKNNSCVHGNVIFKGGDGIVMVTPDSKVHGKIIGGTYIIK